MNEIRAKEEHRPLCGLCKKPFDLLIEDSEEFYPLYGHIACNLGVYEQWDEQDTIIQRNTWHHVDDLLAHCYRHKDHKTNVEALINKIHEHEQSKRSQND